MLGRQENACVPSIPHNEETIKLYQRCIFTDLKIAIDLLKEFNDKLKLLHPDVFYRIRNLM